MKKIDISTEDSRAAEANGEKIENKVADMDKNRKPQRKSKKKKIIIAILVILVLLISSGALLAVQASKVVREVQNTVNSARGVYDAGKNQDLITANQQLEEVKSNLDKTNKSFQSMKWASWIPFFGRYWHDGNHGLNAASAAIEAADILADTIEPYADVLGFKGQGSFLGGTAEDRIVKAVETLEKVTPQMDAVAEKLEIVVMELKQIDPGRYPFEYQGRNVGDSIQSAQDISQDALFAVTKAKPAMEKLPQVMGVGGERKYMILFQNDAELRATGGFMTAFAILRVEKGKVFQEKSEDIYALDEKFNSQLPVPEIIKKYHKLVYRQYLRDINLSPDFKFSMDAFSEHYNNMPGEPEIDGIIAVDTQVLKEIVEVLGPIEVAGYGTYSSESDPRCDCPQIVYELEALADRPTATFRENRKGVLAPMMQAILTKAYGSPKQLWPELVQTAVKNINEKHVLFYMYDEEEQKAAELLNIAGRIVDFEGDYFHLNDINFAGAKSNMFTNHQVEQVFETSNDGEITKIVTIKYENPFPPSNCNLEAGELCLNGILRDVVRLYVPKNSQLIEVLGSEVEVETREELDKTVFEAFFTLNPESQAKLVFKYKLPFKTESQLKILIQKQPGKRNPKYVIITPEDKEEFELVADKELILPF